GRAWPSSPTGSRKCSGTPRRSRRRWRCPTISTTAASSPRPGARSGVPSARPTPGGLSGAPTRAPGSRRRTPSAFSSPSTAAKLHARATCPAWASGSRSRACASSARAGAFPWTRGAKRARRSACTCRAPHTCRARTRCRLLLLQPYLLEWRRPGVGIDQHQPGLLHARPDSARPEELEDGTEAHALVEGLLDLVQQGLALLAIGLDGLLPVQGVDVGIAAVRVGAVARHDLRHPRGRVAVEAAAADAHTLELLRSPRREEGGPLHRPHLELDPEAADIVHDGFAPRKERRRHVELPRVEAVRVAGLGQELPGLRGIVGCRLDGQRELAGPV